MRPQAWHRGFWGEIPLPKPNNLEDLSFPSITIIHHVSFEHYKQCNTFIKLWLNFASNFYLNLCLLVAKIRSLWIWLLSLEEDYMLCQVSFSKDNLRWPELGLLFIFTSNILATFVTQGWQDGPMKHIIFRSHSCHVHVVACRIRFGKPRGLPPVYCFSTCCFNSCFSSSKPRGWHNSQAMTR